MSVPTKQLVKAAQERLNELGHKVSLGHCYEAFAALQGYDSWNIAKAQDPIIVSQAPEIGDGRVYYEVKVKALAEVKTYITVKANSPEEAKEIALTHAEELDPQHWESIYIEGGLKIESDGDIQEVEQTVNPILKPDQTELLLSFFSVLFQELESTDKPEHFAKAQSCFDKLLIRRPVNKPELQAMLDVMGASYLSAKKGIELGLMKQEDLEPFREILGLAQQLESYLK